MTENRKIFDSNRSLIPLIGLFIVLIGVSYLNIKKVIGGEIYWTIFIGSIVIFFLILFFIKENEDREIEYPFSDSLLQSISWGILGYFIPVIFNLFSPVKSFEIIRPFALFQPLSITNINLSAIPTSIDVIRISLDKFWTDFFLTGLTAGFFETWIFQVVLVVIGILLGKLIIQLLDLKFSKSQRKWFVFLCGFLLSGGLFVLAHGLNGTYVDNPNLFIIAFIFLLIMNIALYYYNTFFIFVAMIHVSINNSATGYLSTWASLFTFSVPYLQIPIILLIGMALYYFIRHIKEVKSTFLKLQPGL